MELFGWFLKVAGGAMKQKKNASKKGGRVAGYFVRAIVSLFLSEPIIPS